MDIESMGLAELEAINEKIAVSLLSNEEKSYLYDRIQARFQVLQLDAMCEGSELKIFEFEDIL